ncbi:N-methyl-L-tryptophan oxidase [Subtercola endophyticus]|uniref:N-methyl-L-tryptophan oxidase n=1 Tax=Subtercola endophyticus TaxID=2895559 RepID=UPI001E2F2395|nr:N-methyl-L-tryptophan oxidase [Subtercola endophyticus]UFS58667.1 N-methyl-L-tryptophan oxidase [Subtercola endophyticus]
MHHLNAAGASIPTKAVLEGVISHLTLEAEIGGYAAAAARATALQAVYGSIARLINAHPDEVALVESATVGWQRLLDSLRLERGARVLATRSTYVSMALNLLELERSRGIQVEILPNDESGGVDLDALEKALTRPAAFVTASHVPTSSGLVEPVAAIGALARAAGVPFILDATQSVGQLPIDVEAINADALFATGRKFLRAPRGTGFLYVSPRFDGLLHPLAPDVRATDWTGERSYTYPTSALRFETWEASHALRLGLGTAADELELLGVDVVSDYVGQLARLMRERLRDIPGVVVTDPPAADGSAIVTFVLSSEQPQQTAKRLSAADVHTLAVPATHGQWDLGARGLERVVRASVHTYNGLSDIDALEAVVREGAPGAARPATVIALAPAPGVVDPAVSPAASTANAASQRLAGSARTADVVVIGAGIYGRSTAWALARKGQSVIQLEQFGPTHTEGSSHGETRMIRRAYPNPIWDELVTGAYAAWTDLSAAAQTELVSITGGVFSRPASTTPGMRGPGTRPISADEAAQLYPSLRVPEGNESLYDPAAGILRASAAMTALSTLGAAAGVQTLFDTRVLSWSESSSGVVVTTSEGEIHAAKLVVCAGPWTSALVPEFDSQLTVTRIVNAYIGSSVPAAAAPPNLGVFSVETGDAGLLYGFSAFEGRGIKVGLDDGPVDDLTAAKRPVSVEEQNLLRTLVRRYVPAADGAVEDSLSCRYTMAPNSRFAVGAVPGRENVLIAAACSGHGFKFGPVLGEALADLTVGVPRPDTAFLAPEQMLSPAG